jgi:hypothetical protein
VTRLARNCTDWYPLLDLCGYRQCLIGDRDGVYDPGSANGRLLLGLKGTISEVELHTLRGRLTAGLLNKAQRGELALTLPAGLERTAGGAVTKDPNLEVQKRLGLVFTAFLELGSVAKVMRSFRDHHLTLPRRSGFGDVAWRTPTDGMLAGVLRNPAYAGAFVYGRTQSRHATYASGKLMTSRRPMSEWKVVLKDRYPAYIDWDSFERIQTMLSDNHAEYQKNQTRGSPRNGAAVLQGIVWCGQCGRKMLVEYANGNRYVCNGLQRSHGGPLCQHLPADPIDAKVIDAFFHAVGPAELEAWSNASAARRTTEADLQKAAAQQVERLRYQALLAERQYNRVDPDNRLIAAELERRWEMALRELKQAEEALEINRAPRAKQDVLTLTERADFLALVPQLQGLWDSPDTDRAKKKAMLRCLIENVVLERPVRDQIKIRIVWVGGEVSELLAQPSVHSLHALSSGDEMDAKIVELARQGVSDEDIARVLNQEGYRSARRLYVPVSTVKHLRQRRRILRTAKSPSLRGVPGWLTISNLAARMAIPPSWYNRLIRNGIIEITRDQTAKRYLFPDTADTLEALKALRSGTRKHLKIDQRLAE